MHSSSLKFIWHNATYCSVFICVICVIARQLHCVHFTCRPTASKLPAKRGGNLIERSPLRELSNRRLPGNSAIAQKSSSKRQRWVIPWRSLQPLALIIPIDRQHGCQVWLASLQMPASQPFVTSRNLMKSKIRAMTRCMPVLISCRPWINWSEMILGPSAVSRNGCTNAWAQSALLQAVTSCSPPWIPRSRILIWDRAKWDALPRLSQASLVVQYCCRSWYSIVPVMGFPWHQKANIWLDKILSTSEN